MDENVERLQQDLAALRDELRKAREELHAHGTDSAVTLARVDERVGTLERHVHEMATGAEARFVLRSQWEPYRQLLASMVLLLLGGLITLGFSILGGGR